MAIPIVVVVDMAEDMEVAIVVVAHVSGPEISAEMIDVEEGIRIQHIQGVVAHTEEEVMRIQLVQVVDTVVEEEDPLLMMTTALGRRDFPLVLETCFHLLLYTI